MNFINFLRLLHTLYGRGLPDVKLIESFGLLAVKIGLVFALRPDFLSEEKCRELTKLYRHTTPTSSDDIQSVIDQNLPTDTFISFDKNPLASASVGQVHKAILQNGEIVAVKVVKKDVAKKFIKDVRSVKRLFKIATFFYPKLKGVANPVELVGQIEKMTLAELDLRNEMEGYNLLESIVLKNQPLFEKVPIKFVKRYEKLSSKDILVTGFVNGQTLDEMLDLGTLSYQKLIDFFAIQSLFIYVSGIFHGDIHPGNIIVLEGNFYYVDAGYIGRVDYRIRTNLIEFFDKLCNYQFQEASYFLNQMAEVRIEGEAFEKFLKDFVELYKDFPGKPVGEMSLTKKMMQTIRMGVLAGMDFGEGIFDIIKSHMYLDGMAIRQNPKSVILEDMRPLIREYKIILSNHEASK